MDDFTKHLLEQIDDQKNHPEHYQITLICDNCKRKKVNTFTHKEVEQCIAKYGKAELHSKSCEQCELKDDED